MSEARKFRVGDIVRFLPKYAHQAPGELRVLAIREDDGQPVVQFSPNGYFHYEWAFESVFVDAMADGYEEYKEIMLAQGTKDNV